MSKTYIGYARVSTDEQNEARQLKSFADYSEKITKIFTDKMSGKDTNRPQLKAMLDYVREGDVVVVSDFSRLARSTTDMLQIVKELTDKGINDSLIHVDFMIGADDLTVTGIRADGSRVPVFVNGDWA